MSAVFIVIICERITTLSESEDYGDKGGRATEKGRRSGITSTQTLFFCTLMKEVDILHIFHKCQN